MKVLLTDGLQRKTLAAARSLSRAGNTVVVAEYTRIHPCRFSRFVNDHKRSPNPHNSGADYIEWLLKTIEDLQIDLVLPMDDDTMKLCVTHQTQIEKRCAILLPDPASYIMASDKWSSVKQAIQSDVFCPQSYFLESHEDLEHLQGEVSYPLIVKPRHSAGSRGIRKVGDWDTLQSTVLDSVTRNGEWPIIQAYIPQGQKVDVCLLYDQQGQLVASFTQEEIRQYPEPMGPSTVQRSIPCGALAEQAHRLMSGLKWKGIAEVEFMADPEGKQFYFMEVNTRFWASLQCAIQSGVDFPVLYKEAAIGQVQASGLSTVYREGVLCRWLFPGDLLRLVSGGWRYQWAPSFFSGKRHGVYDDIYDSEDWLPVLGVFATMLRFVFDIKMWKSFFWRSI